MRTFYGGVRRLAILAALCAACGDGGGGGDGDGGPGPGDPDASGGGGGPDAVVDQVPIGDGDVTCTTGVLFAGNPSYPTPADRPTEGTGLLEDPPLGWRGMTQRFDTLYTTNGRQVWSTDLSQASPVLHRVAGVEDNFAFRGGPCAEARFANATGIAMLVDSLVVADPSANAVVQIDHPDGAGCTVRYVAGTSEPQQSTNPFDPPNQGDADGPGASATFRLPRWPVVGPGDVIYVWDSGNHKVRSIAPDGPRTVDTVASVDADFTMQGMTMAGGKLYLVGSTFTESAMFEVDPGTGNVTEVVRDRYDPWMTEGSDTPSAAGASSDGTSIITYSRGRIFNLSAAGEATHIAGNGAYAQFTGGYDPTASHPALDLELLEHNASTAGAQAFLHYRAPHLYFAGVGTSGYVVRITCE
jgi:hypothetical protein